MQHIFIKSKFYLLAAMIIAFVIPSRVFAFQHAYKPSSDSIYALARHEVAVYANPDGEEFVKYLPEFTGLKVISETKSWYEIEYKSKSVTKTGWVTKDDFTYDCLIYDGTEKQPLANGTYTFRSYNTKMPESTESSDIARPEKSLDIIFKCTITFVGDDCFTIRQKGTNSYLKADENSNIDNDTAQWGDQSQAGIFRFERNDSYFNILDASSERYMGVDDSGFLNFSNTVQTLWHLKRKGKAIQTKNLHVFVQFDPEWASHYYGKGTNDDPSTNNYCTSACGIFATMNAIYSLTGQYADPVELANYAVDKHYRIQGNGTDSAYFKAAAAKFGSKYGFKYDGSGESLKQLRQKLASGDTAIAYLPGHYASIVDYSKKKNKYLLLDSHYLPKRGTSSFGDWVSAQDLERDGLLTQGFFYYKQTNSNN